MHPLQTRINYQFRDSSLLELALRHPSLGQGGGLGGNNQRLEFLGDSVLSLCVAQLLYTHFPHEAEGGLHSRHSALVRRETLAQVARALNLSEHLQLGASEKQSQGQNNDSNLEDALEALIGAIYLDGGLPAAAAFIGAHWQPLLARVTAAPKDSKTTLQEWAQARGLPVPVYTLISSTGPAHAPVFTIEALVQGQLPVQATATSKRAAEQAAAAALLAQLSD